MGTITPSLWCSSRPPLGWTHGKHMSARTRASSWTPFRWAADCRPSLWIGLFLCILPSDGFGRCTHNQGQFRTTLQCPGCGYETSNFDTFQYLSLPIPALDEDIPVRVYPYLDPRRSLQRVALDALGTWHSPGWCRLDCVAVKHWRPDKWAASQSQSAFHCRRPSVT